MNEEIAKLCPIQIEKSVHDKMKEYSKKSGIKIKSLAEVAILAYLNKMKFQEEIND